MSRVRVHAPCVRACAVCFVYINKDDPNGRMRACEREKLNGPNPNRQIVDSRTTTTTPAGRTDGWTDAWVGWVVLRVRVRMIDLCTMGKKRWEYVSGRMISSSSLDAYKHQ